MQERRHFQRFARPLEGSWRGASGATRCRIGDIGLGGCFIHSISGIPPGTETTITMTFEDRTVTMPAVVIYVEQGMGFGVHFTDAPADDVEQLRSLIDEIEHSSQASA